MHLDWFPEGKNTSIILLLRMYRQHIISWMDAQIKLQSHNKTYTQTQFLPHCTNFPQIKLNTVFAAPKGETQFICRHLIVLAFFNNRNHNFSLFQIYTIAADKFQDLPTSKRDKLLDYIHSTEIAMANVVIDSIHKDRGRACKRWVA